MANRIKRTSKKDERFFAALAAGRPVADALRDSGYKRTTVYEWREADEAFSRRWNEAIETAIEAMESEADRRAIEGVLEPVFYQGQEVGAVRRYSDTLLIFRLKALNPQKYRERASIEHTGNDGGPIRVEFIAPDQFEDPEQWERQKPGP